MTQETKQNTQDLEKTSWKNFSLANKDFQTNVKDMMLGSVCMTLSNEIMKDPQGVLPGALSLAFMVMGAGIFFNSGRNLAKMLYPQKKKSQGNQPQ